MIARDCGDAWQVVLQTDHGDLAGELAVAWGGGAFAPGSRPESMVTAARRHDDGWAVWERSPRLKPDSGAPLNFYELDPAVHLSFYGACIDAVTEQDPYAGRLIGMHCAGIYRGRYGVEPGLKVTLSDQAKEVIDAFVAEQERITEEAIDAADLDEASFWADYRILQVFDRLALVPPRTGWEPGESQTFERVPLAGGGEGSMTVTVRGEGEIELDPFPLLADTEVGLVRRMVPKAEWGSDERFAADLYAAEPELITITYRAPQGAPITRAR